MLQFPLGDVVIDLYDEGEPAKICESFTRLCARKYYHGCLVYQVQSGCLAQTGDPVARAKVVVVLLITKETLKGSSDTHQQMIDRNTTELV